MKNLNLIHSGNSVKLNYMIEQKEIYFDIYVSPDDKVCIIGKLDNNYSCWCSITSIQDREKNANIFNHVIKLKNKVISNETHALGSRYEEIKNWHRFQIYKRDHLRQLQYYSPVSSIFVLNGKTFANEIQNFSKQEREKCEFRLKDLTYKSILETYQKILSKNANADYYNKIKPLINIIESESYLKLCPDSEIRKLYIQCANLCRDLYNRYMTVTR